MRGALIELAGWYGAAAILGAYALLSFGMLGSDSILYQALNISGGMGLVAISLHKRAYPPAVLNIVWSLVGIVALATMLLR